MVENNKSKKEKIKSKVQEYIEAIIIAILIALVLKTFVIQAFKIPSGSMEPTLLVGDQILVNKFIYGVKMPFLRQTIIPVTNPEKGDIVVFIYPKDRSLDFIKRVIGVGEDTIEIKNKKIFVNGKELSDPYGVYSDYRIFSNAMDSRDNFGPITVPKGSLFVMGDNRDNSRDSRYWGFVDLNDVEGKAFIIYWSWNHEDAGKRWFDKINKLRWRRLGSLLH